ncbi:hypothetical protein [Clostridium peptidivorans]|uniref:hypothetical protein n=1 Tax=Clostridium peptidivorans TaxID=100174 RepID=UPI0015CD0069|nr:hypothetical protein [Clostridium peptidivorans]
MKRRKGEHEEAMETAKNMLESNIGMTEILASTDLSEDEVKKAMNNMNKKIEDNR